MNRDIKKTNGVGLLPILLFLLIYLGSGIITGNFKNIPIEVAFFISACVALIINKKEKFSKKVEYFCKGGGNPNIILMISIFILASIFSQISKNIGSVTAIVEFGLSIFPGRILIPALFIISCFLSLAIGTSVGTIVALTPIAIGVSESSGNPLGLCCAAVLGGAMFGDNLSIISDTTIVATKTQNCEMKDKFYANIKLVIFPVIVSVIMFYIFSNPTISIYSNTLKKYDVLKMLPYIIILIMALTGIDVFIVLFLGIIISSVVGLLTKSITFLELINSISTGIRGTGKIVIIVILIGGIIELVKLNGGLEYIIENIKKRVVKKRDAEVWIGILVLIIDICVGNNTIAVASAGPIAKEISDEYKLTPKIVASILDTVAAGIQGVLPYSNPMLAVLGIATNISSFEVIRHNYYNILMIIVTFIAVYIRNLKIKD